MNKIFLAVAVIATAIFFLGLSSVHASPQSMRENSIFDYMQMGMRDGKIFLCMDADDFAYDMQTYESAREVQWKCPYCFCYWGYGERCKNPKCPANLWDSISGL